MCDGAIEGSVCMCVCVHVYVDMYMCMCAYIILTLHTQQWEDLLDGEDDSLISDDQPSTEADPDCNVGVVEVPLSQYVCKCMYVSVCVCYVFFVFCLHI